HLLSSIHSIVLYDDIREVKRKEQHKRQIQRQILSNSARLRVCPNTRGRYRDRYYLTQRGFESVPTQEADTETYYLTQRGFESVPTHEADTETDTI
ncbi:hypothetical protein BgiBS90_006969, partial [Biomphalaria glabrata]